MSLYLVRHGETEWSRSGQHTSVTDLPLLPEGEAGARALRPWLTDISFAQVLTSPRQRALRTAELAGFPDAVVDDDLAEWSYGDYEGLTTPEILRRDPGWTIWDAETPGGETADDVETRLDRVVAAARTTAGDTLVFAHGHILCALAARWLAEPARNGRFFRLGTSSVSIMTTYHEQPVVQLWNASPNHVGS